MATAHAPHAHVQTPEARALAEKHAAAQAALGIKPTPIQSITPSPELLKNLDKYTVIDVREPAERHEPIGYVPTSINVPLQTILTDPKATSIPLEKKPVIFICGGGFRSRAAAEHCAALGAENGFREIFNLETGTRGWHAAGLETAHDQSPKDGKDKKEKGDKA